MQTDIGFREARSAILSCKAKAHALWAILSRADQRDGYALKPSPWEGPGEYQYVEYHDERGHVFIRLNGRHLPRTVAA